MVRGFADLHNHQFSYLGFGGRAMWGKAYGQPAEALSWCTPSHGPAGVGDVVGNFFKLMYGGSLVGHLVGGHPQHDGWPRWDSVTHQAVYEDWLKRAVDGGLRLMVMLALNSEFLCGMVNRAPGRSCLDMEAVDLQLEAAKKMERYIDTKAGGPGAGWYRIVHTPEEAHSVMEAGKLAVILGIEVDSLFGCWAESDLSENELTAQLDKYAARGVRHVFPIHFANNGFGGAAFQNPLSEDLDRDQGVYPIRTEAATEYSYRGGRRNVQGLTTLGKALVRGLIERGMIIDVDHMSARSKADTFALCREAGHPVVSGHTGFTELSRSSKRHEGQLLPSELREIEQLGGMVAVIVRQGGLEEIQTWEHPAHTTVRHVSGDTSNSLVQAVAYATTRFAGRAVGFGTDFNGFAGLPGPRFGPEAAPGGQASPPPTNPMTYPFIARATGKQMQRSKVGQKTFDYNIDGLAHVGMLPDMLADFEAQGLPASEVEPLLRSADAYLRLWFRATGRSARALGQSAKFLAPGHRNLAVWRPAEGNWYVMDSASGQTKVQQWGQRGDVPVPGDYSGDGRADFAVWRPAEGNWYVMDSASGQTKVQQWGTLTDLVV